MTAAPDQLNTDVLQAKGRHLAQLQAGGMVTAMIALGDKLGLYRALAEAGPVTSDQLAAHTGLHERWLREWLQAQAAAGVIEYEGEGRFRLTPEAAVLLADDGDLRCVVPGFAAFPELVSRLERLPAAFASGLGIAWDERAPEAVVTMERRNAAWFRQVLVPVALPLLDGVVGRLEAGGLAADVGCGTGVALIAMAQAFPRAELHGYETSARALERAEENRARAGVGNVRFHHADRDTLPGDGRFDLITTFDCVHDMTQPAAVVRAIRAALRPDGTWFIADINGRPTFEENLTGNPLSAMAYSISVLGCLSAGLSEPDGAGLGTLGLPEPAMQALAAECGFSRFRRVDLPSPVNAFYAAQP